MKEKIINYIETLEAKGDWVEIKKERIEVVKDRTKGYLDIPTLQAINKQVEELGWE